MIRLLFRWTVWALAILAAAPGPAGAEDRAIEDALEIHGATTGCIDGESLGARLARWLGRDSIAADIRVQVHLRAGPGASFTLHRASRAPAERTFPSLEGSCADRVDALALALAIALDPEAVTRRVREEEGALPPEGVAPPAEIELPVEDAATEAEVVPTQETAADSPEPNVAAPRQRRFAVALGGGLLWGGLEAVAPMALLALDVTAHPAIRVRVAAVVSGERRSSLGSGRYGARLVGGELGLRAGDTLGPVRLEGSVALVAAAFLANGEGYGQDLGTRRPWLALAIGPRLELPLTPIWALGLGADAVLGLLRAQVHVMDPTGSTLTTASTPAAGLRAWLEAIARF